MSEVGKKLISKSAENLSLSEDVAQMIEADANAAMKDHLTFFIDILGFAEATKHWTSQQTASLIGLMHNLAALRSEFDIRQQAVVGGTQYRITPAITTFSDHIVISYPVEKIQTLGGNDPIGTTLLLAQNLISRFAATAMTLGLLIRGGATVGQLYHAGGVVLGSAMNEAYELESRVAVYPRIAVSRKLYSRVQMQPRSNVLLQDNDGITHFNYFTFMILSSGDPFGDHHGERCKQWLDDARGTISANINKFERNEQWNPLSKWAWFQKQLEEARAGINDALFK